MTTAFAATGTGRIGDVQEFVVPVSAFYRIRAAGAEGGLGDGEGDHGGRGAVLGADCWLNAGERFEISVGQKAIVVSDRSIGGGGGSAVVLAGKRQEGQIRVLYHQRQSSPTVHDTALINHLEAAGHAVTVDSSNLSSLDIDNEFDLLIVPSDSSGSFNGPAGASAISQANIPMVSMCRHTSRNAFAIPVDGSLLQSSQTSFVRREEFLSTAGYFPESVTFTSASIHRISDIASNRVAGIYSSSTASQVFVAEYRPETNRYAKIHFGYWQWDNASQSLWDLLDQMIESANRIEIPLVVAGGGGGYGVGDVSTEEVYQQANASLTRDGKTGVGGRDSGQGGVDGAGGFSGSTRVGGGGGWFSHGEGTSDNPDITGGESYRTGNWYGGENVGGSFSEGGFGGGGGTDQGTSWGACAGGGGWSGGGIGYSANASAEGAGGGGGSFINGFLLFGTPAGFTSQETETAFNVKNVFHGGSNNTGHGWVEIRQLGFLQGAVTGPVGEPAEGWKVRIYKRETGEFLAELEADEVGFWRWDGGDHEVEHYAVAIDPSAGAVDFVPSSANRLLPVLDE